MALRFFADHCVPSSVAEQLESAGYEVLLLRNHLPTDAGDDVVIGKAQELESLLLSINGDIADLLLSAVGVQGHRGAVG